MFQKLIKTQKSKIPAQKGSCLTESKFFARQNPFYRAQLIPQHRKSKKSPPSTQGILRPKTMSLSAQDKFGSVSQSGSRARLNKNAGDSSNLEIQYRKFNQFQMERNLARLHGCQSLKYHPSSPAPNLDYYEIGAPTHRLALQDVDSNTPSSTIRTNHRSRQPSKDYNFGEIHSCWPSDAYEANSFLPTPTHDGNSSNETQQQRNRRYPTFGQIHLTHDTAEPSQDTRAPRKSSFRSNMGGTMSSHRQSQTSALLGAGRASGMSDSASLLEMSMRNPMQYSSNFGEGVAGARCSGRSSRRTSPRSSCLSTSTEQYVTSRVPDCLVYEGVMFFHQPL